MKRSRVLLVLLACLATFLLVYTPHYNYPFPRHIDEWHHISEAVKLQEGGYSGGFTGFRIGFHLLLLLLSKITNLVLIYRFLPAAWAALSALTLFYVVYKKTDNHFFPALLAMIFFASIKSNVNITGLWFFNPLTFSIPFIYLYVYFFTEGLEKQNKKFLLLSGAIMLLLLPIHAISVLFAVSFLLIYSLFNLVYIKKEWKFFSIFLLIPLTGLLVFKFMTKLPWKSLIGKLIHDLQFRRGWGVLEIKNSPFELYSLIGYVLAILGLILILGYKENRKKYLAYALWPIALLASIILYRMTGNSFLSPYQRNLYYFALSLPFLSAFGLGYLLKLVNKRGLIAIIVILMVFFTFKSYFYIPRQIDLYKVIDRNEHQALLFLSKIPEKSTVLAIPRISTAIYAVSRHKPVATYFFYGKRKKVEKFFGSRKLKRKQKILNRLKVKYLLVKSKIHCDWKLIYEKNGCYVYEINSN